MKIAAPAVAVGCHLSSTQMDDLMISATSADPLFRDQMQVLMHIAACREVFKSKELFPSKF